MTLKSYLLLSGGGGLLATYLLTSQPGPTPAERAARQPARPRTTATQVDIQREASRLQTRVPSAVEYSEPSRNPFRFGSRPAAPPPASAAPAREVVERPVDIPVDAPAPPPIRLSGVANDGGKRTAFLVTGQGVLTVREGDAVAPGYRVGRIEEDAIELVAADGTTRRLKLRP